MGYNAGCCKGFRKEGNEFMTSKRFWKDFISGKYAFNTDDKKEYLSFARMCDTKGLKWPQGTAPEYESYSSILDLCIIYDDLCGLLCVDFQYCLNNDIKIFQYCSLPVHGRAIECKV